LPRLHATSDQQVAGRRESPDGNGVEIYVDESDVWRKEPQRRTFEELVTRMVELTAPSLGRTGTKDCSY